MWYIWFVIPCALLFILSTLCVGIFDDLFLLQIVIVVGVSFLLLPAYYDRLPRKWTIGRKVRTHIVFSLSIIALLYLGYAFRLGVMKEKSYDYRFGYYSGPFRILYSAKAVQFVIESLYELAPLKYRIGLFQAEDLKRVSLLKKDVHSDQSRFLLCYDKDRSWCFLQVMKSSAKAHPPGTAGTLALLEVEAQYLKEAFQLHPERQFQHLKESAELLNLITQLSTSPETELKNLVPGFPQETREPVLTKLLKKEKKVRFTLSHHAPLFPVKARRGLTGKF